MRAWRDLLFLCDIDAARKSRSPFDSLAVLGRSGQVLDSKSSALRATSSLGMTKVFMFSVTSERGRPFDSAQIRYASLAGILNNWVECSLG